MTETVSRSASAGMNRPGRASARGQGPAGGWIDLVSSTTSRRSSENSPSTTRVNRVMCASIDRLAWASSGGCRCAAHRPSTPGS